MSSVSATATAPSNQIDQRTALDVKLQARVQEDADRIMAAIAPAPRSFSYTSTVTGQTETVTCLPGCELDHDADSETPTHPADIYCHVPGTSIDLPLYGPMCETGRPEEFRVLSWQITVRPFASEIAARLPHLAIEVVDDHWIEPIDPDALAVIIDQLQEQLGSLRQAHTQLVAARASYRQASVVTA